MIPNDICFVYDKMSNDLQKYYNLKNVDPDVVNHKQYGVSTGRFRNAGHHFKDKISKGRNVSTSTFKQARQNGSFIVYEIGTVESPNVWLEDLLGSSKRKSKKNIFDLIYDNNPKLYQHVRNKTAIIHIDQGLEAFPLHSVRTSHWTIDNACYYKVIHEKLEYYKINASSIHYSTANLHEQAVYDQWCIDNNILDKIVIHSYNSFALAVSHCGYLNQHTEESAGVTIEEHLEYKSKHDIKTFSNLNRVIRTHRVEFLKMLNYYDLIKGSETSFAKTTLSSLVTYPAHPAWSADNENATMQLLPLTLDVTDFNINQAQNFFKETYLNTWYSVVTETFFQDYFKYSIFFSEKIFKPMRARHPFILVGQPYGLRELKNLGFKTFDSFWDESYDECRNPTERLEKICMLIKHLNRYTKSEWLSIYREMESILEHNYNHLRFTDWSEGINV